MIAKRSSRSLFLFVTALIIIVSGAFLSFRSSTIENKTTEQQKTTYRSETPTQLPSTNTTIKTPKTLTELKTILTEATEKKLPVIIDFYAPWCPPCKKMLPIFEEAAAKYGSLALFVKINVDNEEASSITDFYDIKGIPHFKLLHCSGEVKASVQGGMSKEDFNRTIEAWTSNTKNQK